MDIVILAGGLGSRFFANSSKIMVNFWGIPILQMLCKNAQILSENVYVIVKDGSNIKLPDNIKTIIQKKEYGTGAAAQSYYEYIKADRNVLIIPGDSPLVDYEVMKKFKEEQGEEDILLGVMKMPEEEERYGRVLIKEEYIQKIIEYKHHPDKTEYANTGIMLISKNAINLLTKLKKGQNEEVYLTEIIELAIKEGYKVKTIKLEHEEALGFNTITEFHEILAVAQKKWRKKALSSQAIFFDINTVYLSYDTKFEVGAIIEQYTRFLPGVKVGSFGVVKTFSSVENCYINGSVGPFANIKSGEVQDQAEIGAFVELNRTIIGNKSKAKHLCYLGDATIGKSVNIGAGCVICNYDGKNKHKSEIQDGSFIGANTTLIAPITIGKKSILAAGSTFTKDVPEEMLSIGRSYQINKERK